MAKASARRSKKRWFVYIVQTRAGSLYTGISTDPDRRLKEHQGRKGAKFFRSQKARRIVHREAGHTRSSALKREHQIKALTRTQKLQLIAPKPRNE